ncbi:unnamed protein product [Penicillium nalgiovense]|nr:unnamed protein product [Penicillium nalgiovense]
MGWFFFCFGCPVGSFPFFFFSCFFFFFFLFLLCSPGYNQSVIGSIYTRGPLQAGIYIFQGMIYM